MEVKSQLENVVVKEKYLQDSRVDVGADEVQPDKYLFIVVICVFLFIHVSTKGGCWK